MKDDGAEDFLDAINRDIARSESVVIGICLLLTGVALMFAIGAGIHKSRDLLTCSLAFGGFAVSMALLQMIQVRSFRPLRGIDMPAVSWDRLYGSDRERGKRWRAPTFTDYAKVR